MKRRTTRREPPPPPPRKTNVAAFGVAAAVLFCVAAAAYNPLLKMHYLSRVRAGDPRAAVELAAWKGSAVVPLKEILLSGPERARGAAARGLSAVAKRTRGAYVLPEMQGLLSHADPRVRAAAASALGRSGVGKCVEALSGILDDPEPIVRVSAVRSLRNVADVRAIELLVAAIEDEEPDVYQPAAEAVRKLSLKVKGAEKPLLSALRKEIPRVRTTAAGALVGLASRISSGAVLELLGDAEPAVRTSALRILVRIGDERACRGIVECLDDGAAEVRMEAIDACARLGEKGAAPDIARILREDADGEVRSAAASALAALASAEELPALARSAADAKENKGVRLASGRTLAALRRFEPLARYGAMEALLPALDDADAEVRLGLSEAMTALSGRGLRFGRREWGSWLEKKKVERRKLLDIEEKVKAAERLASEHGEMAEAMKMVEGCVSVLDDLIRSADPEDKAYFNRLQERVNRKRYQFLKFAPGGGE